MLNYNQPLSEKKSFQDLQMKEVMPIMKLIIRGKKREFFSAIGKSLDMLLPTKANTSSRNDKFTAVWLSPDEWMIFSNQPINETSNNYEVEHLLNYSSEFPVSVEVQAAFFMWKEKISTFQNFVKVAGGPVMAKKARGHLE